MLHVHPVVIIDKFWHICTMHNLYLIYHYNHIHNMDNKVLASSSELCIPQSGWLCGRLAELSPLEGSVSYLRQQPQQPKLTYFARSVVLRLVARPHFHFVEGLGFINKLMLLFCTYRETRRTRVCKHALILFSWKRGFVHNSFSRAQRSQATDDCVCDRSPSIFMKYIFVKMSFPPSNPRTSLNSLDDLPGWLNHPQLQFQSAHYSSGVKWTSKCRSSRTEPSGLFPSPVSHSSRETWSFETFTHSGFTRFFHGRCDDHLMVYRISEQRCLESSVPLYISTIDFTKAFDRIKHSALWSSLQFYGVEPAYVRLLQRLYSQQEGTVLTDEESDTFQIKRRTKQGDLLSFLLFNTVLQFSLESDLKRCQEKQ